MLARPMFRTRPRIAALALLAGGSGAWADDPNPYYLGVTESVTHDSNVYRVPDGPAGTYWSTGLVGGFDQSVGRQHFTGAGNVAYNSYGKGTSVLDNTNYGANLGWDWSTIERLSGSLSASATQGLASYSGNATLPTTERNILRTDQIGGSIRYGGYGRFSLGADYRHSRVHYSAPEYFGSRSSADSYGVNIFYNVNPDLALGVGYRLSKTDSPEGSQVGPNAFEGLTSRGRNIDLTLNYHYTTQTSFNGRLSFTRQSNSGAAGQDFSGLTGALSASYMPTGKIGLNLTFARDAGTNGNFFNATTLPTTGTTTTTTLGLYQSSQVTNSLSAGLTYAATAKISATAGYTYRHARIVGSTTASGGFASGNEYTDNLRLASLGANYTALRWLSLTCNLSRENRNVGSTGGFAYSANVIGCTAQATLR